MARKQQCALWEAHITTHRKGANHGKVGGHELRPEVNMTTLEKLYDGAFTIMRTQDLGYMAMGRNLKASAMSLQTCRAGHLGHVHVITAHGFSPHGAVRDRFVAVP